MQADEQVRVLVVCAANQCRSRTAEVFLLDALREHPAIAVHSAGVDVRAPLPMCAVAEQFVIAKGHDVTTYAPRPAQPATQQLLAASDLILVADAEVRAGITALSAAARRRTFTMPAAAAAAAHILEQQLVQRALDAHAQQQDAVTELIDGEHHTVAGALQPQSPRAAATWLTTELEAALGLAAAGPRDITDAHGAPKEIHPRTLSEVEAAMYPVWGLLRALDTAIRR